MERVRVRCTESRLVADDSYHAGEEYEITRERAERYAAYFEVIAPVLDSPRTRMKPVPENK